MLEYFTMQLAVGVFAGLIVHIIVRLVRRLVERTKKGRPNQK